MFCHAVEIPPFARVFGGHDIDCVYAGEGIHAEGLWSPQRVAVDDGEEGLAVQKECLVVSECYSLLEIVGNDSDVVVFAERGRAFSAFEDELVSRRLRNLHGFP